LEQPEAPRHNSYTESQKRAFQRSEDEELTIKYQGGKDKGIFGPLMRTHGFE